jgi:hypothetical protein
VEKIDSAVLGRIKKSLALANHGGTGEQEAKAALRCGMPVHVFKLSDSHCLSAEWRPS